MLVLVIRGISNIFRNLGENVKNIRQFRISNDFSCLLGIIKTALNLALVVQFQNRPTPESIAEAIQQHKKSIQTVRI